LTTERTVRRLAAILAIDMVGYSRHMEADETGTIARHRQHRQAVIEPLASENGGRVVKTLGDGLLIEFASVVGALESAVGIQRAIAKAEAALPKAERIVYRAGLNLGDIVIDGDDIFGDGVNIAARLEALAEPGGILISAGVFEQVVGKLDLAFDNLGEQQVKNIRKPVRIYRVRLEIMGEAGERPPAGGMAAGKPSIAVLPFTDMSPGKDQEYFADGIAEDVMTELARNQAFFVTARNSSFTYKGRPVDVKQVAGELGVRYVLEGSVRRSGSRVRITAQLIDAATGNHVWAERYDREIVDIFAVQDDITTSIAGVVAPELLGAEMERARRTDPASMGAWDLALKASWHAWRGDKDSNAQAKVLARQAIELDPQLVRARVVHAMCDVWDVLYGWTADPLRSLAEAHELARAAVASDPRDAEAQVILGVVTLFIRDFDDAPRRLETALKLNANLASAHMWGGGYYAFTGDRANAYKHLKEALRLSPRDPANHWTFSFLGLADFAAENYADAVEWALKAIHVQPAFPTGHRLLTASYAMLGDQAAAQAALETLLATAPGTTIASTRAGVPWKDAGDMDRYLAGLRRAGMAE
jgi:adenylate cyclase